MKDEMNIENFEQFLKNQTDKHRMYPGDQVWRNINKQLHGNSRWPALTFAAILTGALLTAGLIFLHPDKDLFRLPPTATIDANGIDKNILSNKGVVKNPVIVDITTLKQVDEKTVMYTFNTPAVNKIVENSLTTVVISDLPVETVLVNEPLKENIAGNTSINEKIIAKNDFQSDAGLLQPALKVVPNSHIINNSGDNDLVINNNSKLETATNSGLDDVAQENEMTQSGESLLSKENPISKKMILNRFNIQIYGGSNISYRRLSEPASYDYHFPYNAALTADPRKNVNNFVNQRPSIGFEFGSALSYALNDRLKIKVGLQFNFRQYYIDAHRGSGTESAVLLLNNSATAAPDSVIVYSAIQNRDGFNPISLQNRNYQLGLPVGIDWTFAEGRKVNFSFGATIQPTYQLNTNMYMVTSDYKSYVQQPNMVRRWNFNAGAEAMANFNAGGLKWQIGPQFRYQMMPTQIKSYSIHENLIDYGIKFGVIKQLK